MSPERNLRVLVVDDHDVVHWGFRLLLTEQPWVERCLTATNVEEALALARRYEPHVALVDLFLGEASGAELSEAIRRESPSTRVLLISGAGWISPQAARAAGASGFVSKDSPAHDVAKAVLAVGRGQTVFAARAEQPSALLSEREREVLELMASGKTNKEIADLLFLSPHTVKEHTSALYRKLRVRNRTEAVRRAERLGLGGECHTCGRSSMRSIHAARFGPPSTSGARSARGGRSRRRRDPGQRAVPQERVGQAVGGRELAEQVSRGPRAGSPRTRPAMRPSRRGRAISSLSACPRRSRRPIAFGGPFQTSSNHSMNTSSPPAGRGRSGTAAGPAGVASRWRRMRRESATTVPSSSSTGTSPWPEARSPWCGPSS